MPCVARSYEVVPFRGVGPVRLGMSRAESRAAMGQQPDEFRKGPKDGPLVDAYHASSFQVFFDATDRVEFIELSRSQDIEARYEDVPVLALPAAEAIAFMASKAAFNEDDPELGFSYEFPSLELAIWRPDEDEETPEGRTFATIAIGRPGYFSERVY